MPDFCAVRFVMTLDVAIGVAVIVVITHIVVGFVVSIVMK